MELPYLTTRSGSFYGTSFPPTRGIRLDTLQSRRHRRPPPARRLKRSQRGKRGREDANEAVRALLRTKAKEEEYARLVGWLAARGMACYDCARPTWKLAPSDAKAWDARALVRNWSVSIHRKFRETHGSKWTNFVCYVPRKHSATPA